MTLLRPVTASLLLSIVLLAPTARWAATDPLRHERTHATQQQQINELNQREQLEDLKRAQDLNETQRQLDRLRHQAASRPGLAAQPRAQQDLKLHAIERESNPLRRQQQIRDLEFQQHRQFLQDQSRTRRMQRELDRLR